MTYLFPVEVAGLLPVDGLKRRQPFLLLGGQDYNRGILPECSVPQPDELSQQMEQPPLYLPCRRLFRLALFGVCQPRPGNVVVFASRKSFAQVAADLAEQIVEPLAALPHQLDVGGIAQMTLITGGVTQTQILVLQKRSPSVIQYLLLPDDVKCRSQTVADGTDNPAVPYRVRRIDEYAAEHLHMNVAVEHLDQSVIREAGIGFQKHQCDLALAGKHRPVALRMPFGEMRRQLGRHLLQRQLGINAPELTAHNTFPIFLQKIVLA